MKKGFIVLILYFTLNSNLSASSERFFYCTREGNISIINYIKFDKNYFYWNYKEPFYDNTKKKEWHTRTKAQITSHNVIADGDKMEFFNWFDEVYSFDDTKPYGKWKFYFDLKSMVYLQQDNSNIQNVENLKNNCVEIKSNDLPK